jgi:hypothetical protein
MERMTDERLAEIEANWFIPEENELGLPMDDSEQEFIELLQALKAERAVIKEAEKLPGKWRQKNPRDLIKLVSPSGLADELEATLT